MRFLRTNTAARVTVGPFFDKTDGVTPETAITVTSCKLTLMVDDANVPTLVLDTAPTASGGANDMVHVTGDDAGFYDLELAAGNVNYLGRAMLAITDAATHCPVFHEFMILPAMIYDSLILGTDRLDTNVTHVADTAQTARDIGASVLLSSGTGAGQISLSSGAVLLQATQTGVTIPTVTTLTGHTPQTGDTYARLGAPAGASVSADVAAVKAETASILTDTAEIGAAGAGLTALASQASVNTIDDFLDTEIAALVGYTDTEVAAILALLDDARTEPGQGAPPVNPDLATKIDYLYKAWRNKKTNDGTDTKLYADDGTTVDHKQATSEAAGTVTKAEWITGA